MEAPGWGAVVGRLKWLTEAVSGRRHWKRQHGRQRGVGRHWTRSHHSFTHHLLLNQC